MSGKTINLVEFCKQQQSQRVQALLHSKMATDNNVNFSAKIVTIKKDTSVKPSLVSPAIIKIIPNDYVKNNTVENKMINITKSLLKSVSSITQPIPSTSSIQKEENVDSDPNESNEFVDQQNNELTTDNHSEIQKESKSKTSINILKRKSVEPIDPLSTPIKTSKYVVNTHKVHSEHCCSCCRDMLKTILSQQQEILKCLKGYKVQPNINVEKLDLLPPMPFNDINDFLDFDESLSNDNVQYQFMIKLSKLLVATDQKSVSNIMSSIMTNELCKSISWIGIKDTIPFGNSNMVGMIIDIVQEHHQIDIDTAKGRIAEWLRRCGDRINNEIRRIKKKMEQGYSVESKIMNSSNLKNTNSFDLKTSVE